MFASTAARVAIKLYTLIQMASSEGTKTIATRLVIFINIYSVNNLITRFYHI